MYHFVDFYSLLNISPDASIEEILTAVQKANFVSKSNLSFSEAARILLDPVLRASYDQEYYRINGKEVPKKPVPVEVEQWLQDTITAAKEGIVIHPESNCFYIVTESLIEPCKETIVGRRVFDRKSQTLEQRRNEARRYFDEREKLIKFWIASNIYKKEEDQEIELSINLIEDIEGTRKEYLIKSLRKITPQSNLDQEARIQDNDRKRIAGAGNNNSAKDGHFKSRIIPESELYAMAKSPTHYQVLNIAVNATLQEITNAYKREQNINNVSMWHPNWNEEKDTYKKMSQINEAYKILSVPALRAEYDLKLQAAAKLKKEEQQRTAINSNSQSHNNWEPHTGQSTNQTSAKPDTHIHTTKKKHWLYRLFKLLNGK